jgi:hypothetical protein
MITARRLAAVCLLMAGIVGAVAWARSSGSVPASEPLAGAAPTSAVAPPTTTVGSTSTSTTIPRAEDGPGEADPAWPAPLPAAWRRRLWLTLPATATSPERSAPVIPVGPAHEPTKEWNPVFGTVEVYQDNRLALPCEGGAVFALGHANYSTVEEAWDIFYDVIDSERYDGDSGLVAGQQIVVSLDDGTEVCRYEVFDLVDGPGEHLPESPGRYILKTALSGEPDDPTGGPDDQLIRRAWEERQPTIYLLGSYAGPSGDEMDASGVHQAYNFVVAARLVDPAG